ncbi:solute carrier organic anion transporter family member 4C1-like [Watersipora subatra]|uniref:solute carrier organic anion transporter family member 4C1-like n=1 Tax=Watersipora subatra TaxID=2589382 RepID=UPI00355B34E0
MNMEGDRNNSIKTSCGCTKSCRPKWLQKFANVKVFAFVLTLCTIVQGFAINGINNVNTVMYERRYQLSSSTTSLVTVFEDLAGGLMVILVGYYGSTGHKPRIIAVGFLVMAAGLFIMCLAQFASPPYNPVRDWVRDDNSTLNSWDNEFNVTKETEQGGGNLKDYIYFLITGQILNGYAAICLSTLGVSLVETSSSASSSALYIGIFTSGAILGPALGFLAGSPLLNIYVDSPKKPPLGLTAEDPAWVGAWWIGFIIAMVLSIILAMVLLLFPKEFRDTAAIRAAKVSEVHNNGVVEKVSKPGFSMRWKDLPKATGYLLTNPVYMLVTFIDIVEFAGLVALATFFSKIMVVQYGITPSLAGVISGCIAIPAAVCGQLVGGIVVKRFKLTVPQMLKFALCATFGALCLAPFYLAKCPAVKFAGVTAGYSGIEEITMPDLNSACNKEGGCSKALYEPVCSNNVQYFSPCHAGCSERSLLNGTKIYYNCSCTPESNGTVTVGQCSTDCPLFYSVYIPCMFLQLTFTSLVGTPMWVATLRVAPPQLRTYGVAVQTTIVKFLGSVPGPLLLGVVMDTSCIIWQDTDGTKGSCWVYDHKKLALGVLGFSLAIKVLSLTFGSLAIAVYKPPTTEVHEGEKAGEKESFLGADSPDGSFKYNEE